MNEGAILELHLCSQRLREIERWTSHWDVVTARRKVPAHRTALLICDMWNECGEPLEAGKRVDALAPRMNEVVKAARQKGVFIIHAPSDTMATYEGTPARQRMIDAPAVEPPPERELPDPAVPLDTSDFRETVGERSRPWTAEHPAIEIDQDQDGISDDGREVYNAMQQRGIESLIIMGIHINMCVPNRSFGIKQMVRWGVDVILVRDMTDAIYNSALPPYLNIDEATRLMVGYVEKFWCPSITSADLM